MSWKRWKRGLLIATLTGIATGLVGLAAGVTWRQALLIILVCVGKDSMLYLKEHPVEKITDTTHHWQKIGPMLMLLMLVLVGSGCTNLHKSIAALGTDTNSVCIRINSPWGKAEFYRNYPPAALNIF